VERIGAYQVLGELARGGMGVVYRARHPRVDREVALKLLLAGRGASEQQRKRFARETQALLRLRHQNLVAVLDGGDAQGCPYLVLELVSGQTLQERLDRAGPLPVGEAASIVQRVAEGLAHAHAQGILHRDLKPANVLVDAASGTPKLTDFGLALSTAGDQSRLSRTGHFLGTPGYWPPEQALGQLDRVGPVSDVYGLGAVLYALLTGEPPHPVTTLVLALDQVVKPPASPRSLRPEVPVQLEAICLRALRVDPAQRQPSAQALAEELGAWLAEGDAPRRGSRLAAFVVTCMVVVGLAGASALVSADRGAPVAASPAAPSSGARSPAPEEDPLLALLGRAEALYVRQQAPSRVLAAYAEALALAPQDPRAVASHLAAQLNLQRSPQALAELAALPTSAYEDPWVFKAVAWAATHQYQGCSPLAERVTQWILKDPSGAAPDDMLALVLASELLTLAEARDEALAAAERAVALEPEQALPWVARASVRGPEEEQLALALADLERAERLEPENPAVHGARFWSLALSGRTDEALAVSERALELCRDAPGGEFAVRLCRAMTFLNAGENEAAAQELRAVLAIREAVVFWEHLATALLELGRQDDVLEACERWTALAPDDSRPLGHRVAVLCGLGRIPEAVELLEARLEQVPDDPQLLGIRANIHAGLEEWEPAARRLEQLMQITLKEPVAVEKRAPSFEVAAQELWRARVRAGRVADSENRVGAGRAGLRSVPGARPRPAPGVGGAGVGAHVRGRARPGPGRLPPGGGGRPRVVLGVAAEPGGQPERGLGRPRAAGGALRPSAAADRVPRRAEASARRRRGRRARSGERLPAGARRPRASGSLPAAAEPSRARVARHAGGRGGVGG
jgi:tetratricopeptide (TPR) repeat protein